MNPQTYDICCLWCNYIRWIIEQTLTECQDNSVFVVVLAIDFSWMLQSEGTRTSDYDTRQNLTDSGECYCHLTICCTNHSIMSLQFANQWISAWPPARPQLLLPVDPSETHTYTPPHSEDRKRSALSEGRESGRSRIRMEVRIESPRQRPRDRARGSDRDREEPAIKSNWHAVQEWSQYS